MSRDAIGVGRSAKTNGTASLNATSSTLRVEAVTPCTRERGTTTVRSPLIATTASTLKAQLIVPTIQYAASATGGSVGAWRLEEMSPTSGVTAMRLAPMNMPQKIASASGLPKMNATRDGSGMSTRKSVSSGTSEG